MFATAVCLFCLLVNLFNQGCLPGKHHLQSSSVNTPAKIPLRFLCACTSVCNDNYVPSYKILYTMYKPLTPQQPNWIFSDLLEKNQQL